MNRKCSTCGSKKFLKIGKYEKCARCFRPYLGLKKLLEEFVKK